MPRRGKTRKFTAKPRVPGVKRCHPRMRAGKGTCLPSHLRKTLRQHGSLQKSKCAADDEKCMIEESNLNEKQKHEILTHYFRPDMPKAWKKDPDMWLNNDDIERVIKQYEEAYPHFTFLEVAPIDFSHPDIYGDKNTCLNKIFCDINLAQERKNGKTLIGAVFNLDHHLKGGSHWVALAIDLIRRKIYYFDSYGMNIPPQIERFMQSLRLQDPSLKLERNGRRFQYGNSECGMYSLYFLIRMIHCDSFKKFVRNPSADSEMVALRKTLFYKR